MAAGDRKANGKPSDIVRHFGKTIGQIETICKQKNPGYVTDDIKDVNCIKCVKKYAKALAIVKANI